MNHLSGIDAAFLYLETPEMPMHVGSLNVLELPQGHDGDFLEDLKAHVASRMHLAPLFTRKLALMPFELANPVWVDDDDIDLDYHVRLVTLPRPGTMAQLEAYVGRLQSSLLDRSRPLWEFYLFEGLQSGQVAFFSKCHHAAMDGAAGAVLANAILDLSAVPRQVKPPTQRRASQGYQLGVAELAGAAIRNAAVQYVKLFKLLPSMLKTAAGIALPAKGEDGKRVPRLPALGFGPRTLFNVSITNQRVFAGRSLSLPAAKRIAKQFNVTLNDVVMALCSAALRSYLAERGGVPHKSLLGGIPVSLREAGNADMNNQAMAMRVSLATDIADPIERLQAINASAVAAKRFTGRIRGVVPMDFPSLGTPWLMTGMVSLIGRSKLATALPPLSNVVISNVPGPPTPLYLAGARMLTNYPVSIPAHGMALNITVNSYNGSLEFGLTACRRTVPDVAEIGQHLSEALTELEAAAQVAAPAIEQVAPVSDVPARRKAARKPSRTLPGMPTTRLTTRPTSKPATPVRERPSAKPAH